MNIEKQIEKKAQIRFVHTADIHFGVENYGKIDPATGIHSRLLDFSKNLNAVVDYAIDQDVDLFLFCGDAYKTPQPNPTQQKLFVQAMLRLYQAHIPVAIIVGNHDHPLSFGKAHSLDVFTYLPVDGFHVFAKPECKTIVTKSGPITIVGIPWPTRNNVIANDIHRFKTNTEITNYLSERVSAIIDGFAQQVDPAVPTILAGHLTVSTGLFSGSEKCAIFGNDPLFLPSQLAREPFDYVALGHLHRYQNLNPNGSIPLIYPGSLERVDFGERKEAKGFCVGTIKKDAAPHTCTYEFIELATRPMIHIEVTLNETCDQTQQILDSLATHNIANAIIKIVYHVPATKKDSVDLFTIQRACSAAAHLVGIFPVYQPIVREKRATLSVDMDFTTLLDRYFESKNLPDGKGERLKLKALTLLEKSLTDNSNS